MWASRTVASPFLRAPSCYPVSLCTHYTIELVGCQVKSRGYGHLRRKGPAAPFSAGPGVVAEWVVSLRLDDAVVDPHVVDQAGEEATGFNIATGTYIHMAITR